MEILRIRLRFTGRFPYAGEFQLLLLKTSPKQASEEGRIMTDQTLGRSNSGPVRLPVQIRRSTYDVSSDAEKDSTTAGASVEDLKLEVRSRSSDSS